MLLLLSHRSNIVWYWLNPYFLFSNLILNNVIIDSKKVITIFPLFQVSRNTNLTACWRKSFWKLSRTKLILWLPAVTARLQFFQITHMSCQILYNQIVSKTWFCKKNTNSVIQPLSRKATDLILHKQLTWHLIHLTNQSRATLENLPKPWSSTKPPIPPKIPRESRTALQHRPIPIKINDRTRNTASTFPPS